MNEMKRLLPAAAALLLRPFWSLPEMTPKGKPPKYLRGGQMRYRRDPSTVNRAKNRNARRRQSRLRSRAMPENQRAWSTN